MSLASQVTQLLLLEMVHSEDIGGDHYNHWDVKREQRANYLKKVKNQQSNLSLEPINWWKYVNINKNRRCCSTEGKVLVHHSYQEVFIDDNTHVESWHHTVHVQQTQDRDGTGEEETQTPGENNPVENWVLRLCSVMQRLPDAAISSWNNVDLLGLQSPVIILLFIIRTFRCGMPGQTLFARIAD